MRTTPFLATLLLLAPALAAQHCGSPGIHDPESTARRFGLSLVRTADWSWWERTALVWKDGEREAELSVPVAGKDLYEGWIFVSPTGNGFLMTGKVLVESYGTRTQAALLSFFSPRGELLDQRAVQDLLAEGERRLRGSCGEGRAAGTTGCFRYHDLAAPPRLSAGGTTVELRPAGSERTIHYYLPRHAVVDDALSERLRVELDAGSQDLLLLANLPFYPVEDVAAAATARLRRIVPGLEGEDPVAWRASIEERAERLAWDEAKGMFVEKQR